MSSAATLCPYKRLENILDSVGSSKAIEEKFIFDSLGVQLSILDINKPLVYVFDDVSSAGSLEGRSAWGFEYVKSRGYNVIGFLEGDKDGWYRSSSYTKLIECIGRHVFIDLFPRIVGYGTSMGGFAASAFSRPLKMNSMLLLAPVSSLNSTLCPWENRYKKAARKNWDLGFYDGVEVGEAKCYLVFDSLYKPDLLHQKRYAKNENCVSISAFGFGHSVAKYMNQIGLLDEIFLSVVEGEAIDLNNISKKIRSRRKLDKYYYNLISKLSLQPTSRKETLFFGLMKNIFHSMKSPSDAIERLARVAYSLKYKELVMVLSDFGLEIDSDNSFFKKHARQRVEFDNNDFDSVFLASVAKRRHGHYLDSIKLAKRAHMLDPGNSKPFRQIADIYRKLNLPDEDNIYSLKALDISPELDENIKMNRLIETMR